MKLWHFSFLGIFAISIATPFYGIATEQPFQAEIRAVEGGAEIGTNAGDGYYLLLYYASTLEDDFAPYSMAEAKFTEPVTAASAFYMLERFPADTPGDWDNDQIDDLFEIRHSPMDPLVWEDHANLNYDTDTYSNMEEYALGTHPGLGDSDGDGFGDDDEVADGTDPLDAGDFPADPDWRPRHVEGIVSARNVTPPPTYGWTPDRAEALSNAVVNVVAPLDAFAAVATAEALPATVENATAPGDANAHPAFAEASPVSVANATPPGDANAHPALAEASPVSVVNTTPPGDANAHPAFAEGLPFSVENTLGNNF